MFKFQKISNKLSLYNKSSLRQSFQFKTFLSGTNSRYQEQMYQAWKKDPNSVHVSWKSYFENLDSGLSSKESFQSPPTNNSPSSSSISIGFPVGTLSNTSSYSIKISQLVRIYQKSGYLKSNIDPLKLSNQFNIFKTIEDFDIEKIGFNKEDLEKEFEIPRNLMMAGILNTPNNKIKLKDLISKLEKAYCGDIGVEFKHMTQREEVNFIIDYMENKWINYQPTKEQMIETYTRLAWASKFEKFLEVKFMTKRFGLEGLESMITGLHTFFEESSNTGVKDITLGMSHRGRLNVLANCFGKSMTKIFKEMMGKQRETEGEIFLRSGDVKYHLGHSQTKLMNNGKELTMDILNNPSHLECICPVVQGMVRAKQHFNKDDKRNDHIGILIHGDAAFSGQGVNYENMQMTNLSNYTTGGLLHVIANNQIGFTTTPADGRSTPFPTDIGKAYDSPIIHVNADNPIAVDFAFKLAADYSNRYPKDLIVDIVGYRRYGHNELDQPSFTQPEMYLKINNHKDVLTLFENKLISNGIKKEDLEKIQSDIDNDLNQRFNQAKNEEMIEKEKKTTNWADYSPDVINRHQSTGMNIEFLKNLGEKINTIPNEINSHPTIRKNYQSRLESIKKGSGIDWATAEALAWGILLNEGKTVRISGQDVERGTFSHRHSVIHDQKNFKKYRPLDNATLNPNNLQTCLSHLSEFAVLGFELGFSYYNPEALVMWEAQFGDFANGAQVIIDQFIVSGENKWNTASGLTLLLPHGMDGQGPEHSSCRIERFLQMVDDDIEEINMNDTDIQIQKTNIQVCNPTTPANYFHVLLRQQRRSFRKPLIIPSPKKLLRLKEASSSLIEFSEGTSFLKVRKDNHVEILKDPSQVKLVLICQGQVYYDLIETRDKLKRNDVAIVTLEQIAPVPYKELYDSIKQFTNAKLKWVQEEHKNSGCWFYVEPRLNTFIKKNGFKSELEYVGRSPSSSPATGFKSVHDSELKSLLEKAFKI